MTGRYAVNSGLPFAVLPGSAAGIPLNIPVLPEILRVKGNYSTHMVEKVIILKILSRSLLLMLGYV